MPWCCSIPILTKLGFYLFGTFIPYYGFFILLGIVCAFLLGYFLCKRFSLNTDDFILINAYLLASGFLGAKVLYIIVSFKSIDFSSVFQSLKNFNDFVSSGFVFYGGLLGGLVMLFFLKIHHIETSCYIKILAPCICIVHACGRIGCSFAGCCYGKITTGKIYFLYRQSIVAPNNVKLFPVQGIESVCLFALSAILIILVLCNHSKKVHIIYLFFYAVLRFVLEFFRGDMERGMLGFLSTSQILSILLVIGILVFEIYSKHTVSCKKIA